MRKKTILWIEHNRWTQKKIKKKMANRMKIDQKEHFQLLGRLKLPTILMLMLAITIALMAIQNSNFILIDLLRWFKQEQLQLLEKGWFQVVKVHFLEIVPHLKDNKVYNTLMFKEIKRHKNSFKPNQSI